MGFPERLEEARGRAGLSKRKLANRLGVPPSSVIGWTKGEYRPRHDQLPRLANELGVRMSWLLEDEGSPPDLTPDSVLEFLRKRLAEFEDITEELAQQKEAREKWESEAKDLGREVLRLNEEVQRLRAERDRRSGSLNIVPMRRPAKLKGPLAASAGEDQSKADRDRVADRAEELIPGFDEAEGWRDGKPGTDLEDGRGYGGQGSD